MNFQKEGVVYTPERIAYYIAKTAIDKFLIKKINNRFASKILNLDKFFDKYILKSDITKFEYFLDKLKNLTVLDPAVGNGHFLIATLKIIEKYYLRLRDLGIINWSNYEIRNYVISKTLHGVDIENEAIENTKKRLLLALEDTIKDSNDNRGLVNIESNYRVGNAIIGFIRSSEVSHPDGKDYEECFYNKINNVFKTHKALRKLKLPESEKKVMLSNLKPFHWFSEFPIMMEKGGFDIIIGNPPYISNKQLSSLEKAIFQKIYETPKGLLNTFGIFLECSIKLSHSSSIISFIVHKNLIRSNNYDLLRKHLLKHTTIEEIIDLGAGAFHFITAETVIIIITTKPPTKNHKILIKTKLLNQKDFNPQDVFIKHISQKTFLEQENYNINLNLQYDELEIITYIKENKNCDLNEFFEAKTCIATGDDEKFLTDHKMSDQYKKTLKGKNIGRFFIDFDDLYVHYNSKLLHRARDEMIFLKPEKLIMQTISSNLTVAYDNQN
ncbi:MAG: N-6 DNA methylase, partial [Promethearchaeota archaeon]